MGLNQASASTRLWLGNFWKARTRISADMSRLGLDRTRLQDSGIFQKAKIPQKHATSCIKFMQNCPKIVTLLFFLRKCFGNCKRRPHMKFKVWSLKFMHWNLLKWAKILLVGKNLVQPNSWARLVLTRSARTWLKRWVKNRARSDSTL